MNKTTFDTQTSDKELRAELAKLEVYTTVKSEKHPLYHKDIDKIMQLITADRKRVALEARIDELIWSTGVTYKYDKDRQTVQDRIAELKAQQEEV